MPASCSSPPGLPASATTAFQCPNLSTSHIQRRSISATNDKIGAHVHRSTSDSFLWHYARVPTFPTWDVLINDMSIYGVMEAPPHRGHIKDRQPFSRPFTPTVIYTDQLTWAWFWSWDEARVPGEDPHGPQESNFLAMATLLITVPSCCFSACANSQHLLIKWKCEHQQYATVNVNFNHWVLW